MEKCLDVPGRGGRREGEEIVSKGLWTPTYDKYYYRIEEKDSTQPFRKRREGVCVKLLIVCQLQSQSQSLTCCSLQACQVERPIGTMQWSLSDLSLQAYRMCMYVWRKHGIRAATSFHLHLSQFKTHNHKFTSLPHHLVTFSIYYH
jgi:hypothetical protein